MPPRCLRVKGFCPRFTSEDLVLEIPNDLTYGSGDDPPPYYFKSSVVSPPVERWSLGGFFFFPSPR